MKRILVLLICCWTLLSISAQELTVKSMTIADNDLSASKYRRMDLSGNVCGLVKIQLTISDVSFEGNVILPVEYKDGEYWVYMAKGSHELIIRHQARSPSFHPCHVFFTNYGISGIESLVTYEMTLSVENMQKLIIDYTPVDAMVIVDSKLQQGNGHLELDLPIGNHDYVIAQEGCVPSIGSIKLNGGSPLTIEKSLEYEALQITVPDNQQNTQFQSVIVNLIRKMEFIKGGTFMMGATSEQGEDAENDEKPAHQVTLSSFFLGKYEVTQEEWEAVMGSNPSTFKGARLPVETVGWNDCQEFIRKLNEVTGKQFRLPTEAEWEYAARGGNRSKGYNNT